MPSMEEAMKVKARHEAKLMAHPTVTGVGLGRRGEADEPVIQVFVSSIGSAPAVPEHFEGVAVEVKERRFELH